MHEPAASQPWYVFSLACVCVAVGGKEEDAFFVSCCSPLLAAFPLTHSPTHPTTPLPNPQGVRTKTVKKSARVIIEKYYSRLTMDFHTNKRVVDEVAEVPSKRMRNKIAGFVTHLMKRIQKGPVRGISLKLQEEERERRLDFVPEVSLIEQEQPEVDQDLRDLMEHIGFKDILSN